MGNPFAKFVDPQISARLITDQGEVVIDEVRRHWVALVPSIGELVLAMLLFTAMPFARGWWFIPGALGLVAFGRALWRIHREHMDRFVITNMRVFRVHGVFSQHVATMPLTRILDIAVNQSFGGRVLGYGHFIFESAAQDQGLREIRYVPDPEQRDLTIQRVIQLSGARKSFQGEL